jgi:hypothetical protein
MEKQTRKHVSYLAIVIGDSIEINEGKRYRYEGCQARKGVDLTEGERSVTVWGPHDCMMRPQRGLYQSTHYHRPTKGPPPANNTPFEVKCSNVLPAWKHRIELISLQAERTARGGANEAKVDSQVQTIHCVPEFYDRHCQKRRV